MEGNIFCSDGGFVFLFQICVRLPDVRGVCTCEEGKLSNFVGNWNSIRSAFYIGRRIVAQSSRSTVLKILHQPHKVSRPRKEEKTLLHFSALGLFIHLLRNHVNHWVFDPLTDQFHAHLAGWERRLHRLYPLRKTVRRGNLGHASLLRSPVRETVRQALPTRFHPH